MPEKNNLAFIHWATRNMLWELLFYNVEVCYQPPPFVHSKLFLVDDDYALLGSANIDPRSLRLNYELGIEIYDPQLSADLRSHFDKVIAAGGLTKAQHKKAEIQLGVCEGSDWFWWFGDYNPSQAVSDFEKQFRLVPLLKYSLLVLSYPE